MSKTPRKGSESLPNIQSNGTLIAFTFLATMAAAIVQGYSYWLATSEETPQQGTWNSAECYSTIQSCIMQLLGLYITVLPALRHRGVRKSYAWWSFLLGVLSAVSAILSVACFAYSPAFSQLALFLGSGTQATIVMQLVFAMDRVVKQEVKEGKRE